MKKISFLLLTFILVFCICGNIYATSSFDTTITSNVTSIKPGETVTITIGISNVNVTGTIDTIKANFEYDKTVFEQVKETDVTGQSGWAVEYTPEGTTADSFILTKAVGSSVSENILKITLKVKSTVTQTSTMMKVNDIEGTEGLTPINSNMKSVTIAIDKTTPIPTNNTNTETVSDTKTLPDTGVNDTVMFILIGTILWGIGSFIAYKKYNSIKI